MRYNRHSELEGRHAILSPSKYHWLRYDEDKLARHLVTAEAAARGTELHEFAAFAIRLGQKLPRTRQTLNMYVNDAIGFKMDPEIMLAYSRNIFGTTDAIKFAQKKLRIHDLKTGIGHASMDQPLIYAGIFCLEYDVKPSSISTELRIYQNDDVEIYEPDVDEMTHVIDRIITTNKAIERIRSEGL